MILLMWTGILSAQEHRAEISIDFRVNSTHIDPSFHENAARLDEIATLLADLQNNPLITVRSVTFCGTASPEGSYQLNTRLARDRRDALEELIRRKVTLPDSLIERDDNYIPWEELIRQVEASDIDHKSAVLEILQGPSRQVPYGQGRSIDSRIPALKQLEQGRVWLELNRSFFSRLRNASVVVITLEYKQPEAAPLATEEYTFDQPLPLAASVSEVSEVAKIAEVPASEEWTRHLYLKTNLVGWVMCIANLALEIDLAPHWSFALPVYYSGMDCLFVERTKFRTFTVQPEFRYWVRRANDGFFVGLHGGMGYYNYALAGDWRIQDHDGTSPSWGGGLSVGYRLSISRNKRWQMEFTAGAGLYTAHYDKFHNEPNGMITEEVRKTFIGVDNAAISFIYKFDLKSRKR